MKKINGGEMKTEHRFIQVGAGGQYPNSWSFQKCVFCGETFTHYYQKESWNEALKKEGISKYCQIKS